MDHFAPAAPREAIDHLDRHFSQANIAQPLSDRPDGAARESAQMNSLHLTFAAQGTERIEQGRLARGIDVPVGADNEKATAPGFLAQEFQQ